MRRGTWSAQNGFRLLDHICIHASADGHGAEDVPALADPHLRSLLTWGRAHSIDQGGEGDGPLEVTELFELLEKFVHEFIHLTLGADRAWPDAAVPRSPAGYRRLQGKA